MSEAVVSISLRLSICFSGSMDRCCIAHDSAGVQHYPLANVRVRLRGISVLIEAAIGGQQGALIGMDVIGPMFDAGFCISGYYSLRERGFDQAGQVIENWTVRADPAAMAVQAVATAPPSTRPPPLVPAAAVPRTPVPASAMPPLLAAAVPYHMPAVSSARPPPPLVPAAAASSRSALTSARPPPLTPTATPLRSMSVRASAGPPPLVPSSYGSFVDRPVAARAAGPPAPEKITFHVQAPFLDAPVTYQISSGSDMPLRKLMIKYVCAWCVQNGSG
jgi:hypothetical protein